MHQNTASPQLTPPLSEISHKAVYGRMSPMVPGWKSIAITAFFILFHLCLYLFRVICFWRFVKKNSSAFVIFAIFAKLRGFHGKNVEKTTKTDL